MNIYDDLLNQFRNKTFPLFSIICNILPLAGFGGIIDIGQACHSPPYNNLAYCRCQNDEESFCPGNPLEVPAAFPTRLSFATFASQNGYLASKPK